MYIPHLNISFIHIPKTAGSTLNTVYNKWMFNVGHHTMKEIIEGTAEWGESRLIYKYGQTQIIPAMFPPNYRELIMNSWRFAVVRNPYHRLRSWYKFVVDKEQHVFQAGNISFEDFILNPHPFLKEQQESVGKKALLTQTEYLYYNDELAVHKVIEMKNFKEEVEEIFASRGEPIDIGDTRIHESKSEEVEYTPKLIEYVKTKYADDFKNFGYDPDDI